MIPNSVRPLIHVVAGAVIDGAGRVLVAQRPDGKHLAGGWEFPGGKLEPGEERQSGLARELHEELGIVVCGTARPMMRVRHTYPTRDILLDVFVVRSFSGVPQGLDRQALRWCTQEELSAVRLLPADAPIVRALRLPEIIRDASAAHYAVVELHEARDARLRGVLCADAAEAALAAQSDADFLVLRQRLPPDELAALCQSVYVPVYARGIALAQAWACGASGTHELAA